MKWGNELRVPERGKVVADSTIGRNEAYVRRVLDRAIVVILDHSTAQLSPVVAECPETTLSLPPVGTDRSMNTIPSRHGYEFGTEVIP